MRIVHGESPDFTIIMSLHKSRLLARFKIGFDNRPGSETNDKLSTHNVNGSDQGWELHDRLTLVVGSAIDNTDSSVFATGVKGTLLPNDGTNKTALMVAECLHASVAVPNVDVGVGATSETFSGVISSHANERSLWASLSEDTSLLLDHAAMVLPVSDVLLTSGPEVVLAVFLGEGDVKDWVSAALVAGKHLSIAYLEEENHMLIRSVSTGDVFGIWRDSDGGALSRVFVQFHSALLFARLGVPNEDRGEFTYLSGGGPLSAG